MGPEKLTMPLKVFKKKESRKNAHKKSDRMRNLF